jgi:hypothetical protein
MSRPFVAPDRFARATWSSVLLAVSLAASCTPGAGSGGGGASSGAGGPAGSAEGGASAGGTTGAAGTTGGAGTTGSAGTDGGMAGGEGGTTGVAGAGAAGSTGAAGSSGGAGRGVAGTGGGGGTTGAAGRGGTSGGGSTGSGGKAGGSGATGAGGRGGSAGATAGAGGGSTAGAGGGSTGPFVCNQLTGGKLTYEWFAAGFETIVDDKRWQAKWREDAYVEVWADAQSSFWTAQIDSTCANNTSAPDRLVFGTVSFKYKTQAEWRTGITQAVNNFKAKWPTVRRIDLVTQIRGPNNMLCPTPPTAGETIAVPPEQDAAMADVAAAFPGFVFVGPKVEAHACSEFQGGGPHLTAAGNMANMPVLANYFVTVQ